MTKGSLILFLNFTFNESGSVNMLKNTCQMVMNKIINGKIMKKTTKKSNF